MCIECERKDARIAELEKQIVDIRDGYRHKIWNLRDNLRGVLGGRLYRYLETMSEIIHLDLPRESERDRFSQQALAERIDDVLKEINEQITKLDPTKE